LSIRNMQFAFRPKSVAVIGGSEKEGSVGRVVMKNIIDAGYAGALYAVNPKYEQVFGRLCAKSVAELPDTPDLGVIVTPSASVPGIIAELGAKGTKAASVITAGITWENGLRQQMLDAARPHLLRIIGPNTLGLMIPPIGLNAGFAHIAANPGSIALLSQSGALATSLMDWAADKAIGFSHIVSLGDQADVDVGDCLDMLAGDKDTKAILLYLESIPNPRKFMSAARAAARVKPVIAIKSGRPEAAAQAAATHTGALSGADRVADAALRRAGILRVLGLSELFDATETIARFPPLERARVGIVTNGGGAGVLAVDQLVDCGGELAELAPATVKELSKHLPATWSHGNPVDIIGDAPAERYRAAIAAVAADPNVDAVLVINCPTGLASPVGAAEGVAQAVQQGTIGGKPVLACWLGDISARPARELLQQAGIASFDTPSEAAAAIGWLDGWTKAQKSLMRVPDAAAAGIEGQQAVVRAIFETCAREGRAMLTEPEAKAAIEAYGIEVPPTYVAKDPWDARVKASEILKKWDRVVVKLLSKAISHKSDVGGVVLNIESAEAAEKAAANIEARVKKLKPGADIEGYAVQPMVARKNAHELIVGVSRDPIFGPVILFGAGGVSVEVVDDTAIALPPVDDVLADDLITRTRISKLLAGYRDRAPADHAAIRRAIAAVSQLVVDFPCIAGIDINPLVANHEGAIALDARIEIDVKAVGRKGPNPDLAIRPYPGEWQKDFAAEDGAQYHLRPIRPADVALYADFFAKVSEGDIRLRFLAPRKSFPADMLVRLTQLDYDREIAFVALDGEGALAGISRLNMDPDREVGEYAVLVRTDLQGQGLGAALLQYLIDYAKADGLSRIEGFILEENTKMLGMAEHLGFQIAHNAEGPGVARAVLELE
jgi:acetyltransferase